MWESVARRLGLKYELVKRYLRTFTMQLSENCNVDEDFNDSNMSSQDNSSSGDLSVSETEECFIETLINYVESPSSHALRKRKVRVAAEEVLLFVFPHRMCQYTYLADFYMSHNMDATWYTDFLIKQVC